MTWHSLRSNKQDQHRDRSLHLDDAQRPQGLDHAGGDAGCRTPRTPSTSARTSSSSPISSRSARTTASRRSSTATTATRLLESGAILMYLGRQDRQVLAEGRRGALWQTVEWLMWQMGGVGPMLGQVHHFLRIRQGQGALRRGALRQGGAPALRRARQAAAGGRVPRRRLLDRRHRDLAVDRRASNGRPVDLTSIPT